ncbi:MAG TPA: hypothetical protein VH374_25485 [Polyangia bacterium]|jgi:hypothetical protein|nr:hypothetical protein [Polyangia bacterium]
MGNPATPAAWLCAAALVAGGAGTAWAQQTPQPSAAPPEAEVAPAAATPSGGGSPGDERANAGDAVASIPPTTENTPSRWHGSILLFDQSATTQTLHVGSDYLSSDPTYELWLAFKPRYYLYETPKSALSVNVWANLYLELTNSDTTTFQREPLLGPTYAWITYSRTFARSKDTKTVLAVAPRTVLPTDKGSIGSGQIIGLGGLASASQYFGLRGSNAHSFKTARLGVGAIYNHPFARATSTVNGDILQLRQDVGGRTITSDQLTGAMNVRHALSLTASGDLRLLPKLELSVSYVWLNAWAYKPPPVALQSTDTGPALPMTVPDPTTYRLNTWAVAELTYEPADDFSISLGYYNLTNQLAPDGTRRDPLWSPAARFFLTVTGNLDVIYARLNGKPHHAVD